MTIQTSPVADEKRASPPGPIGCRRVAASVLPTKQKSSPNSQEEGLQVLDKRLLQIALGILVLQVEEFEYERVFDRFLRTNNVFGTPSLSAPQHGGLVLRESGALVELRVDLPVELSNRPSSSQSLGFIELAGVGVRDR